jgi:hypothetical protein
MGLKQCVDSDMDVFRTTVKRTDQLCFNGAVSTAEVTQY